MAEHLTIIFDRRDYEELQEGMTIEEIFNTFIDYQLFREFPGVFEWFNPWDDRNESFFGADDPERFRSIVTNWNPTIDNKVKKCLEELQTASKESEEKNWINFVMGRLKSNGFDMFELARSIYVAENIFQYGHDKLVQEDECYWTTTLYKPEEYLAHPEYYGVLEVYYH